MKLIRDNVKGIRTAKGVSGSHVARALNLKPQGYYYIEAGHVNLSAERLKAIAGVLGERVEVFFDEELTKSVIERIISGGDTDARNISI